jgi:hypothetical protein
MRGHVNIFDSIILGFARGKRSKEPWDDEFPQREAAYSPLGQFLDSDVDC